MKFTIDNIGKTIGTIFRAVLFSFFLQKAGIDFWLCLAGGYWAMFWIE